MTSNELKTIISKLEHIASNTENALCTTCEDLDDTTARTPITADSITGISVDIAIGAAPEEAYNMSDLIIADVTDLSIADRWLLEGICIRSKARKRGQPRKQLWTVIACSEDCVVLRSEPKTAKSKLISIGLSQSGIRPLAV